ncbi:MAG: hypothetical protein Q9196_001978 [Gyalolechia fulgens]
MIRSLISVTVADTSIATGVDEGGNRRKRRKSNPPDSETDGDYTNKPNARQNHFWAIDNSKPLSSPLGSSKNVLSGVGSESVTHALGSNLPDNTPDTTHRAPSTPIGPEDVMAASTLPPDQNSRQKRRSVKGDEEPSSMNAIEAVEIVNKGNDLLLDATSVEADGVDPRGGDHGQAPPSRKMTRNRPNDKLIPSPTLVPGSRSLQPGRQGETVLNSTQAEPRNWIRVRTDGKLVSPKRHKRMLKTPVDEPRESIMTQADLPPIASASKGQTSPKKLMKVRSDGRLASPKSQANTDEPPKRRRGRPRKSVGAASGGLVIIKYGKTNEVRVAIGEKIAELFPRSETLVGSEIASGPAPGTPEPLKATHPFFLGKLIRKRQAHSLGSVQSGQADNMVCEEDGHVCSTSPGKKKSPRKSAANVNGGICASVTNLGQNSVTFGGLQARRCPGAFEPIWPPKGMVHVRSDVERQSNTSSFLDDSKSEAFKTSAATKLKHAAAKVMEDEEVLYSYIARVEACRARYNDTEYQNSQLGLLRVPTRKVVRGSELQRLHCDRNPLQSSGKGRSYQLNIDETNELSTDSYQSSHAHPALTHLLHNVIESRTAFDQFECEMNDWAHKYTPKKAEDVLQPGQEAVILKDWLRSLTVNAIGQGTSIAGADTDSARAFKKPQARATRKKRKRVGELDGFVVSSDGEADAMDQLDDDTGWDYLEPAGKQSKGTVLRNSDVANIVDNCGGTEKSTNAVVISGPSGCGKTAAVYAAARELGFEVFEINAGNRRSGRDILDKVGDMARNHLVNRARPNATERTDAPDKDAFGIIDDLKQDIEGGRQGTMNKFLQPNQNKKKPSTKGTLLKKANAADVKSTPKAQKQSVILLEEVDVLFEEDKQFWATALELIVQSRRAVIMTCTDERLLPLDVLPLFGILRFRQPPTELATDFLLLLACSEGHLLSRDTVSALYRAKCNDLRASITELQFFCQMAIGDTKGGLEWMLIQPRGEGKEASVSKRVVSDGTYQRGMGWIDHKSRPPGYGQTADDEIEIVSAVCNDWGIDLAVQGDFLGAETNTLLTITNDMDSFKALRSLDLAYDALSAADTLQCPNFRTELSKPLDCTCPGMSEKDRANYTEGATLVQADLLVDHSGASDSIAATLRVLARRIFCEAANPQQTRPLDERHIIDVLPEMVRAQLHPKPVTPQTLSTAFTPLSKPSRGSSASRGPLISNFDGPSASVVQDMAPYVRAIVSYDLRLEEQRRQLGLAAQNGRDGKRARTTRASRAALEGGSKANTRRERWFPINTDFQSILDSGGKRWHEEALRRSAADGAGTGDDVPASRRSSVASIESRASGT